VTPEWWWGQHAICFLSQIALKSRRMATSVLPKPTSPHTPAGPSVPGFHVALHVGDGPGLIRRRTYSKAASKFLLQIAVGLNAIPPPPSAGHTDRSNPSPASRALRVFSLAASTTCLRVWTARRALFAEHFSDLASRYGQGELVGAVVLQQKQSPHCRPHSTAQAHEASDARRIQCTTRRRG